MCVCDVCDCVCVLLFFTLRCQHSVCRFYGFVGMVASTRTHILTYGRQMPFARNWFAACFKGIHAQLSMKGHYSVSMVCAISSMTMRYMCEILLQKSADLKNKLKNLECLSSVCASKSL